MHGSIPLQFAMLDKLECLALGYNSFSGSISDVFLSWENIKVVDLESNLFTGAIPEFHDMLFSALLSDSFFTGTIPSSIVHCQDLKECK